MPDDDSPSTTVSPLTRLPGRAARLRVDGSPGGTLWLAPHHLLQVQSGVLREGYRRFAYRDIQSVGVRRTGRGVVYNVILGVLAAMFGTVAVVVFAFGKEGPERVSLGSFFAGISVLVLLLWVFHLARGTTVRCDVRTAVGFYPLPSLSRMRPARRALELIRQRVEAAQGALSGEDLAQRIARVSVPAFVPTPAPVTPPPPPIFVPTTPAAEVTEISPSPGT